MNEKVKSVGNTGCWKFTKGNSLMAFCRYSNLKRLLLIITVTAIVTTITLLEKTDKTKDTEDYLLATSNKPTVSFNTTNMLKIFHLDLKGAPPKLSYLYKLLPLVKKAGGNGILIEYEDMFPFTGKLKNISAHNAYTKDELRHLIDYMNGLNFEIIPLVQTFGHLEYVLKLEEFMNLREVDNYPMEICPSNRESFRLIKEMIIQVMALHKTSKYLHIGCDEVRNLGVCHKCLQEQPRRLFATHVGRVSRFIKSKYPHVTTLIWDDMLRSWNETELEDSYFGSTVQPVVWFYGNNIYHFISLRVWNMYSNVFPKIWIATAFKGAFGEKEFLPPMHLHFENHNSWVDILESVDPEVLNIKKISGIFLTGWSRYDHFALLCELLPIGIPSLILNLAFLNSITKKMKDKLLNQWINLLDCSTEVNEIELVYISLEDLLKMKLRNCSYPGEDLYQLMVQYGELKIRFEQVVEKLKGSAWLSNYNIEKNFTSLWRVSNFGDEGFAAEILRKDLSIWKSSFLTAMAQYYDRFTIEEWDEQNITPMEKKLDSLNDTFAKLFNRKIWPRRPLG